MSGIGQWLLTNVPASVTIRMLATVEYLRGEPEIRVVRALCDGRGFVDVGANRGVYSFMARRQSSTVTAFEPNEAMSSYLESWSRGRIDVRTIALSNVGGKASLTTPVRGGVEADGLSTLAGQFDDSTTDVRTRQVLTAPLDSIEVGPVGFLKVDVEGHEIEVLRGAQSTIARYQPIIQVECEERHRPGGVRELRRFLEGLGYRGFFVIESGIQPIENFNVSEHQQLAQVGSRWSYVNNFYFCAQPEHERWLRGARFRARF